MQSREIHFVIDRQGKVETTVKGVRGAACAALATEWEDLGRVLERTRTSDFYRAEAKVSLNAGLSRNGDSNKQA